MKEIRINRKGTLRKDITLFCISLYILTLLREGKGRVHTITSLVIFISLLIHYNTSVSKFYILW
jgi:hypothetical protein